MTCARALSISSHSAGFGARVDGLDLRRPLDPDTIAELRSAWLTHRVIYLPDQRLDHAQLERFTRYFGEFGEEPFVQPVAGHRHILEVRREPQESVVPFGTSWHSDWSFQPAPPSATILHAKVIPPIGGNTKFADGVRALDGMDPGLRNEIQDMRGVHSARRPYSHEGFANSGGDQRSMTIQPSDDAWQTHTHPLVRTHAETGLQALWLNPVYTIGIEGMPDHRARALLERLFRHALHPRFIYTHKWDHNMLTMWDNRCVQHAAQGGYDGYLRVMHRTTVRGEAPC